MAVLDSGGDTKVRWNPEVPAEVASARRTFEELRNAGYRAFATKGNKGKSTGAQMTEFDPQAEGLVMMTPPMVAG